MVTDDSRAVRYVVTNPLRHGWQCCPMAQRDSDKGVVGHRRPTLRDVAKAAGVSQSTTSRAISGRGYVADDVRRRVLVLRPTKWAT